MLPPGAEFLGPILQAAFSQAGQSGQNAASLYGQRVDQAEQVFGKTENMLENSLNRANQSFGMVSNVLQDNLGNQNKLIAAQQESQLEQIEWEKQRAVRQATQDAQDRMNSMRAEIALGGAIGSSNALAKVRDVK